MSLWGRYAKCTAGVSAPSTDDESEGNKDEEGKKQTITDKENEARTRSLNYQAPRRGNRDANVMSTSTPAPLTHTSDNDGSGKLGSSGAGGSSTSVFEDIVKNIAGLLSDAVWGYFRPSSSNTSTASTAQQKNSSCEMKTSGMHGDTHDGDVMTLSTASAPADLSTSLMTSSVLSDSIMEDISEESTRDQVETVDEILSSTLGALYGRATPSVVKQAWEVLSSDYEGSFLQFKADFLDPVLQLLLSLQESTSSDNPNCTWPLSISDSVVVHLSRRNCKYLRGPGDFCLCACVTPRSTDRSTNEIVDVPKTYQKSVGNSNSKPEIVLCNLISDGLIVEYIVDAKYFKHILTMEWAKKLQEAPDNELSFVLRQCLVASEYTVRHLKWEDISQHDPRHYLNSSFTEGYGDADDYCSQIRTNYGLRRYSRRRASEGVVLGRSSRAPFVTHSCLDLGNCQDAGCSNAENVGPVSGKDSLQNGVIFLSDCTQDESCTDDVFKTGDDDDDEKDEDQESDEDDVDDDDQQQYSSPAGSYLGAASLTLREELSFYSCPSTPQSLSRPGSLTLPADVNISVAESQDDKVLVGFKEETPTPNSDNLDEKMLNQDPILDQSKKGQHQDLDQPQNEQKQQKNHHKKRSPSNKIKCKSCVDFSSSSSSSLSCAKSRNDSSIPSSQPHQLLPSSSSKKPAPSLLSLQLASSSSSNSMLTSAADVSTSSSSSHQPDAVSSPSSTTTISSTSISSPIPSYNIHSHTDPYATWHGGSHKTYHHHHNQQQQQKQRSHAYQRSQSNLESSPYQQTTTKSSTSKTSAPPQSANQHRGHSKSPSGYNNNNDTRSPRSPTADPTSPNLPHSRAPMERSNSSSYLIRRALDLPSTVAQVNQDLLYSGIAILPGCQDYDKRNLVYVFTSSSLWHDRRVSSSDLAQLLMFYYHIPRKRPSDEGMSMVADIRGATSSTINILLEALYLLQDNIPKALSIVHLFADKLTHSYVIKSPVYDAKASVNLKIVLSADHLHEYMSVDQIPTVLDGQCPYNHESWIRFRKKLEPFMSTCRSAAGQLVELMEEMSTHDALPATLPEVSEMIHAHEVKVKAAFENDALLNLQADGPVLISSLKREHESFSHSEDFKYALEQAINLHKHLQECIGRLARLSDLRMTKLHNCLQLREYEEECAKVIDWLSTEGHAILQKHVTTADNLKAVRQQQKDFERFYFSAMSYVEKGNDLLEEANMLSQSGNFAEATGYKDLARTLKRQLNVFTGQLEESRERIEATARCYIMLDKCYEWALGAMKYMSSMKMEHSTTAHGLDKLLRSLNAYLVDHPPISQEHFSSMTETSRRLRNSVLLEQCGVARERCEETHNLLQLRLSNLRRARNQLEVENALSQERENNATGNIDKSVDNKRSDGGGRKALPSTSAFDVNDMARPIETMCQDMTRDYRDLNHGSGAVDVGGDESNDDRMSENCVNSDSQQKDYNIQHGNDESNCAQQQQSVGVLSTPNPHTPSLWLPSDSPVVYSNKSNSIIDDTTSSSIGGVQNTNHVPISSHIPHWVPQDSSTPDVASAARLHQQQHHHHHNHQIPHHQQQQQQNIHNQCSDSNSHNISNNTKAGMNNTNYPSQTTSPSLLPLSSSSSSSSPTAAGLPNISSYNSDSSVFKYPPTPSSPNKSNSQNIPTSTNPNSNCSNPDNVQNNPQQPSPSSQVPLLSSSSPIAISSSLSSSSTTTTTTTTGERHNSPSHVILPSQSPIVTLPPSSPLSSSLSSSPSSSIHDTKSEDKDSTGDHQTHTDDPMTSRIFQSRSSAPRLYNSSPTRSLTMGTPTRHGDRNLYQQYAQSRQTHSLPLGQHPMTPTSRPSSKKILKRANTAPISILTNSPILEEDHRMLGEHTHSHSAGPHASMGDHQRNAKCISMLTGSSDSLPSLPEEEEAEGRQSTMSPGTVQGDKSSKDWTPVPVNSHLHHSTSSNTSIGTPPASMANLSLTDADAKSKRTVSLVMAEMIQTERDYVRALQFITEHYIPELARDDVPQMLRGKRTVVFGNLEKIHQFHSHHFLRQLEACQNQPFLVGQVFLQHETMFYLYALYNKNKPKSDILMQEYGKEFFGEKQLELGDKMDLSSYLLKPVQRMGKYALLLKQLLKECSETDPEYPELKASEEMVKFQLRHGNDLLAMDSLRDCDVNLQEQGRLLRQEEFLVFQGRKKSMRRIFLFEDLILFSKTRRGRQGQHDIYVYKYSFKTADIGMTENFGDSGYKFEIWFRRRSVGENYVLQAPSSEVKKAWIKDISRLLWRQAIRNRESRINELATMGIGNKPCMDIKPSDDNIQDRSINVAFSNRGCRTRNSIAISSFDYLRNGNKRPHSIVSVSSTSSSGSSHSSSLGLLGSLNLAFDPLDSPRLNRRSYTSNESGIVSDHEMSSGKETGVENADHPSGGPGGPPGPRLKGAAIKSYLEVMKSRVLKPKLSEQQMFTDV